MLVGGLTGLFVVAGYLCIRATLDGAGPGDWLQFAGSIAGVLLTVAATLLAQHIWASLEAKRANDKVYVVVTALKSSLTGLVNGDPKARPRLYIKVKFEKRLLDMVLISSSDLPHGARIALFEFEHRFANFYEMIKQESTILASLYPNPASDDLVALVDLMVLPLDQAIDQMRPPATRSSSPSHNNRAEI
jgi:hypothetical protein